jgi:hypothetical protein
MRTRLKAAKQNSKHVPQNDGLQCKLLTSPSSIAVDSSLLRCCAVSLGTASLNMQHNIAEDLNLYVSDCKNQLRHVHNEIKDFVPTEDVAYLECKLSKRTVHHTVKWNVKVANCNVQLRYSPWSRQKNNTTSASESHRYLELVQREVKVA